MMIPDPVPNPGPVTPARSRPSRDSTPARSRPDPVPQAGRDRSRPTYPDLWVREGVEKQSSCRSDAGPDAGDRRDLRTASVRSEPRAASTRTDEPNAGGGKCCDHLRALSLMISNTDGLFRRNGRLHGEWAISGAMRGVSSLKTFTVSQRAEVFHARPEEHRAATGPRWRAQTRAVEGGPIDRARVDEGSASLGLRGELVSTGDDGVFGLCTDSPNHYAMQVRDMRRSRTGTPPVRPSRLETAQAAISVHGSRAGRVLLPVVAPSSDGGGGRLVTSTRVPSVAVAGRRDFEIHCFPTTCSGSIPLGSSLHDERAGRHGLEGRSSRHTDTRIASARSSHSAAFARSSGGVGRGAEPRRTR
jgi:hypothetical protein